MSNLPFGIELEHRELMAHQYLFYVLGTPIIDDKEYDRREKMYLDALAEETSSGDSTVPVVGPKKAGDYTSDQISLALALVEARGEL